MNLEAHYKTLYDTSIKKILGDSYEIDNLINSPDDNRFGITLLARPSLEVKNKIQRFLGKVKLIDPHQYFYNNSDIHVTIISIISCYKGFKMENIDVSKYIATIENSLNTSCSFKINFRGITVSPSCIMIQGFPNNTILDNIRNDLRNRFNVSGLEQSIDQRYAIRTAHSTVVRFKDKLRDKDLLLSVLEDYRNHNFGTFGVNNLELVYNDWYQKEKHVKKIHEFNI